MHRVILSSVLLSFTGEPSEELTVVMTVVLTETSSTSICPLTDPGGALAVTAPGDGGGVAGRGCT